MAVGFSGSNGGIEKMAIGLSGSNSGILENNLKSIGNPLLNTPLEISYFINNICNLNCKHCYVGYNEKGHELNLEEWKEVFNDLIDLGGLTFGNVGKEPLVSWDETRNLMHYLYEKRKEKPKIRFGLVTNGTLFDERIIEEISEIMPNYIDISLDGTEKEHDYIRGRGIYSKVIGNLKLINKMNPELSDKIFISSVLMKHNKDCFKEMISEVSNHGINHFLISPYVKSEKDSSEELFLDTKEVINFYKQVVSGGLFNSKEELEIILKNDYDALKPVMDKSVQEGIINLDNLLIDEYTTIFNKYDLGHNRVIINYIPTKNTFKKEIRISHDGFVSNCYAQFFENYPERKEVIGNIKEKPIQKILKPFVLI